MADYTVTLVGRDPSEVDYAEVLDNGWVKVKWRHAVDRLAFYPPHRIDSVRIPADKEAQPLTED